MWKKINNIFEVFGTFIVKHGFMNTIIYTLISLIGIVSFAQESGSPKGQKVSFENVEYIIVDDITDDIFFYQKVFSDSLIEKNMNIYLNPLPKYLGESIFLKENKKYAYFIKTQLSPEIENDSKEIIVDFNEKNLSTNNISFKALDYENEINCNNSIYLCSINADYKLVRYDNKVAVLDNFCEIVYSFEFDFSWKYNLFINKTKSTLILNCNNDYFHIWDIFEP